MEMSSAEFSQLYWAMSQFPWLSLNHSHVKWLEILRIEYVQYHQFATKNKTTKFSNQLNLKASYPGFEWTIIKRNLRVEL